MISQRNLHFDYNKETFTHMTQTKFQNIWTFIIELMKRWFQRFPTDAFSIF